MQNNGLRCFLGGQFGGVNHNFGIGRRLVWIRDAGKFLDDAGASLGVKALTVALFTDFDRGGRVHQYESSERVNHLPHGFARRFVGSDGRAHGNAAVLRDLGGNVADAPDVDVPMLLGETQFAREVLAHQVAIEQSDRTSAHLQELRDQRVGDS